MPLSRLPLIALVFFSDTLAGELPETVSLALQNTVDEVRRDWAFTEIRVQDGSTTIANYDPRLAEDDRWQLTSVDGKAPSDKVLRKFRRQKKKEERAAEKNRESRGLSATIDADSLELIAESQHTILYRFQPVDSDGSGFMDNVDGTLIISKPDIFVESLTLENNAPIKPAIGVRLDTFRTTLKFSPIGESGPVLPAGTDTRVVGKAYLAVKFDEVEQVRYENWVYVGDSQQE